MHVLQHICKHVIVSVGNHGFCLMLRMLHCCNVCSLCHGINALFDRFHFLCTMDLAI